MLAGLGIMHTELRARMWYQAARAVVPPIPPTMGTMTTADRLAYMNTLDPEGLPVAFYIVSRVSHPEYIVRQPWPAADAAAPQIRITCGQQMQQASAAPRAV